MPPMFYMRIIPTDRNARNDRNDRLLLIVYVRAYVAGPGRLPGDGAEQRTHSRGRGVRQCGSAYFL